MKKALSLTLALILAFSVCTVAFAKNEHHFNFGWETPSFNIHQPQQPQKPENDKNNQGRPENPAQRPEGGTCTPGDPNCPDYQPTVTDTDVDDTTVTDTDIKDIFDAVKHLKDKGHHGKHFRMPKSNDKFFIVGMIINEDGTIEFIYVEKGKEDKGHQRFPAHKNDVTGTDVTGTDISDAPEGMDFITLGDADADGKINAKDALKMLKHAVKKAMMEHEGELFLADMNEDGVIDAKDALKALRKAVGKED